MWIGGREVLLLRFASPIETLSFQAGCMFTLRCTLALPAARAHAIPCLQSATCAEMIKQSDQKERGLQITPKNQTNNKSLINKNLARKISSSVKQEGKSVFKVFLALEF